MTESTYLFRTHRDMDASRLPSSDRRLEGLAANSPTRWHRPFLIFTRRFRPGGGDGHPVGTEAGRIENERRPRTACGLRACRPRLGKDAVR